MAPVRTEWPVCRSCGSAMQFLAQLPLSAHPDPQLAARDQVLLLFQCQGDPGMCEEWAAAAGGNAAMLCSAGGMAMAIPVGTTTLPACSSVAFRHYDDQVDEETPDDAYCALLDDDPEVLGKIGGVPLWIQGDETPACACGCAMTFFAQIEERGGGGINFGDSGAGYAFVCTVCRDQAKFLWQCC